MLIGLSLGILVILSFLSMVSGNDFIGSTISADIDASAVVDGGTKTFELDYMSLPFTISPELATGIVIFSSLMVIAGLVGLNILGSGLNETASRYIIILLFYMGIWGLFSSLAWDLIISIEGFGYIIYMLLSIAYIGGVSKKF